MARKRKKPTMVSTIDMAAVEDLLERTEALLRREDHDLIKGIVDSLVEMTKLVREGRTTLAQLRRLVGFTSSEKSADVLKRAAPVPDAASSSPTPLATPSPDAPAAAASSEAGATQAEASDKKKGHGRKPVSAYGAATHIPVPHESLHPGDVCQKCTRGKVHRLKEPAPFLRIVGQAPLVASCWDCERMRCGACGWVYTARAPEEAQGPKYTETAASMMALLRYGIGVPHYRLDHLQRDLETPVPISTQWAVLDERAVPIRPAFDELFRQGAQGSLIHNDDSHMGILAFMGKRRAALLRNGLLPDPERTGLFTTAIVSITAGKPIVLFFTGRKYAGENLDDLLDQRAAGLPAPLHMGDGLSSRNVPQRHAVDESNCNAHGRRYFVDEVTNFPAECEHVLDMLAIPFKVDKECRAQGLSPEDRLLAHQRESGPAMEKLEKWMRAHLDEKRVEPNSGLGKAFNYMLKRWGKLTLYLRVAGAPLDNNVAERALKRVIMHRKNSLFYKTLHGAQVGDLYMSLIHTAELHHENPFDYLTALQVNATAVAETPADWMPWNYRATLAQGLGPALARAA